MKSFNYPKLRIFGTPGTRFGVRQLLTWSKHNLYLQLIETVSAENLEKHLRDNKDHYNKSCEEDKILFTDEFITDIINNFEKYRAFLSELDIFEVAQNLEYYDYDTVNSVPEPLYSFFEDKLLINLYNEDIYQDIRDIKIQVYELDPYCFISLNGEAAFVLDRNNDLVVINQVVHDDFMDIIYRAILKNARKKLATHTRRAEDYRFPRYYETDKKMEEKYIMHPSGNFVQLLQDTSGEETVFKKLGG